MVAGEQLPALYIAASGASKRGHFWFRWLTMADYGFTLFGLLIAVAITAYTAAAVQFRDLTVFALAGTFVVALVLKLVVRASGYDKDWLLGRAIAEAVKSQSWLFATRVSPYQGDDADDQFGDELGYLVRRAGDIRQSVDRVGLHPQQITAWMRDLRAQGLPSRLGAYSEERLTEQAKWYGDKSTHHRRRATLWFWMAIFAQVGAAVSAFFAIHLSGQHATPFFGIPASDVGPFLLRVMSLLAALAIAVMAWTQLNRNDELARAYANGLQELGLILDRAPRVQSEDDLGHLVRDGEEIISRENRAWVAKRGEQLEEREAHAE